MVGRTATWWRRQRLSLRRRVVGAFAVGALALTSGLSFMSYELARTYLLGQRERAVIDRTYATTARLNAELQAREPDIPRVLSSLVAPSGSHAVVLHEGRWFATSLEVGRDDIPEEVRAMAREGRPGRQLFALRGTPHLAVGVPFEGTIGAFFEVSSLDDLARTLRVVRNALAAASAVTTVVVAAVLTWAGRRLLAPLTTAAQAAAAVGSGHLDVRLDTTGDADLDTLAEAFNGMTAALKERIEREARFASAVSHELRSPLTTLATSVSVLQARRHELDERSAAALDLLAADVFRFQRLVEDLLEISRMDAGAVQIATEVVRAGEFAARALRSAKVSDLPVDVAPSAAGALIEVDKRRLERVIVNLVGNAQTHGGGLVRLGVEADDGKVRLAVEDAGPGVAPEDRERIFEPFVRGRAAGSRGSDGGSGLGLSLVAEHVRLHGGSVRVEDRDGGGARFVVELPAAS